MSDRRSRWFPSEPTRWVQSDQTHLLYQDFHNRVVPYRNDPEAYTLQTKRLPHYHVNRSLSLGDHARGMDGFLRGITTKLLTNHEVWLEVSFGRSEGNRAPFAVSEVNGVRGSNSGRLIQDLPSLDELPEWFRHQDQWERQIELDTSRMVRIVLPDAYPSHLLTRVVRDLADVASIADLATVMDPWNPERPGGSLFDAKEFIRTRDLAIIKAALPIGWTAREILLWPRRQTNEYYYYWRELHFLHFLTAMRARAEDALRQVLALAGDKCGFVASVTAHGVHTSEEVQELIHKFEAGDLAFSSVNDIILEKFTAQHSKQRRVV